MNFPETILKSEEKAIFRLRSLYRSRGYEPYKMSKFEEYDLYVRNKSFLVSDNIITFTDTDGKLMALKPDVTLSIIKNTRDGETKRVYYNENVYRVSDGSHSYKEIMQAGLECIGDIDTYSLSEVITLAIESLWAISDEFVLDVSHIGIVSTLIDKMQIDEKTKGELLSCIGEKNIHGIEAICKQRGIDASRLTLLIRSYGKPREVLEILRKNFTEDEFKSDIDCLEEVLSSVDITNLRLDFSVVSDTNYYNGIVFKGFVKTIPGAVLSGGQYDALMKRLSRTSGAVGFAVYLDCLEGFSKAPEYDVDTLVVYSDTTPTAKVCEVVRRRILMGESVRAQKRIPEKLKYKTLVEIHED